MGQGCVHVFVNGKNPLQKQAFYTVGESFVKAKDLKISDKLLLSDGSYGIIEAVRAIRYDKPQATYNFEVADFHTYYVGNGVLVHNKNCGITTSNGEPLYRGGNNVKVRPRDVDIVDGLVQPIRGISLNIDPAKVTSFGHPHKVLSIPKGLNIIPTGGGLFEIVVAKAMTLQQYQNLLLQVVLMPI